MIVSVVSVDARPLAGVRAHLPHPRVASVFRTYLDQVYAARLSRGLVLDGQNVFVYREQPDGSFMVEFGVGARAPFSPVGDVQPLSTPSGRAATATHVGAYDTLGSTYAAIRSWCRAEGHAMAPVWWEVYGHWTDDVSQLRTDIFILLEPHAA